jgi:hypothetical protein
MIFHTAAEEQYYSFFFKKWHSSIRRLNPTAQFNLQFVGNTENCDVIDYCGENDINLNLDPISFEQIQEKYKCNELNARGYYAISRWISLPIKDDHVCMTDVDLLQINAIDFNLSERLDIKQFISFSKQKNNKTNKMMFLGLNKNFVKIVKEKSIEILNNNTLTWDRDTSILKWMVLDNNFDWEEHTQLYCLNDLRRFPDSNVKFGYYSSVDFVHDNIKYNQGLEAKAARYEIFAPILKVK